MYRNLRAFVYFLLVSAIVVTAGTAVVDKYAALEGIAQLSTVLAIWWYWDREVGKA